MSFSRTRRGRNGPQFAIEDFIQTDAVINPGNSGGPMVNLRGQVVGINTAIASRTGYYQGYGFAIPVDLARRIMEDLVEFGEVPASLTSAWQCGRCPPSMRSSTGSPRPMGALIQQTVPGSPAATAGLKPRGRDRLGQRRDSQPPQPAPAAHRAAAPW